MSAHNNIEVVYGNFKDIDASYVLNFNSIIPEGLRIGKLLYYLVDDLELLKINRDFLGHDYYTDIITFDYGSKNKLEGEVWISVDRVLDNQEFSESFESELKRVCIHGLLHLLGYKDGSSEEKKEMRAMELKYMRKLESFT